MRVARIPSKSVARAIPPKMPYQFAYLRSPSREYTLPALAKMALFASPTASILDVKSVRCVHEHDIVVFVIYGVQPSLDHILVFVFQYRQLGVRIGLGHSIVL